MPSCRDIKWGTLLRGSRTRRKYLIISAAQELDSSSAAERRNDDNEFIEATSDLRRNRLSRDEVSRIGKSLISKEISDLSAVIMKRGWLLKRFTRTKERFTLILTSRIPKLLRDKADKFVLPKSRGNNELDSFGPVGEQRFEISHNFVPFLQSPPFVTLSDVWFYYQIKI